ncbi:MAG: hypothetical protein ACI4HJ_02675 [Ruminococcus sp.]
MSIAQSVDRLISKYGDTIIVADGKREKTHKAIIQPLMYKNKMYLGGDVLPTGYLDKGHYLMTGPVGILGDNYEAAVITHRNIKYIVKRAETITASDEELYTWAVLEMYGEEVSDEY